jgi:hypothetical protein
MRRLVIACLGLVLLGSAGYCVFAQEKDPESKPKIVTVTPVQVPPGGQPGGVQPPGFPGGPGPLGRPGAHYKELIPALVEALRDSDADVRQAAAATLVQVGPEAVTPLVEMLKDKDKQARANAAYVLGHLGESTPEAVSALTKALKDEEKEVRRRAAFALHLLVRNAPDMRPGGPMTFGGFAPMAGGGMPGPGGGAPRSRISVKDPGLFEQNSTIEVAPPDKLKPK